MTDPYQSSANAAKPPAPSFVPRGVRVFAALLVVGGVSLFLTMAWLLVASEQNTMSMIAAAIWFLISGVFAYTGVQLWRGQRWAYQIGTILYVLQIPVITSGPITYLVISGVGFILSFNSTGDFNVNFYFGGNFQLWIASGAQDWLVGVNLVGAIGARYLYEKNRDLADATRLATGPR